MIFTKPHFSSNKSKAVHLCSAQPHFSSGINVHIFCTEWFFWEEREQSQGMLNKNWRQEQKKLVQKYHQYFFEWEYDFDLFEFLHPCCLAPGSSTLPALYLWTVTALWATPLTCKTWHQNLAFSCFNYIYKPGTLTLFPLYKILAHKKMI